MKLVVGLLAVGHHHERPSSGHPAENLLCEPEHGEALARPLGVPEDAELLPLGGADPLEGLQRGVHAEVLVVARERLDEATRLLVVGDEALNEIEQPRRLARSRPSRARSRTTRRRCRVFRSSGRAIPGVRDR